MNKRILGGVMAAGLAFSAFSASAAHLGVDAAPLQVGQDNLVCDSNGVDVVVGFGEHEDPPGALSQGVTVSDIDEACLGQGYYLTVKALDSNGEDLALVGTYTDEGDGELDSSEESMTWSLDPQQIARVEVHING